MRTGEARPTAYEVVVPASEEELAVALLHERGTSGIEIRAQGAESVLLAFFPHDPELHRALPALLPSARARPVPVPEVDWVARFREGFRRFEAAGFVFAPPWDLPDATPSPLLVVEPGPGFGTGTHETTQLCLRALRERVEHAGAPGHVLDVGTGAGLLALAALKLGARLAVGLDLDAEALAWARHQAHLNRLAPALVRGDGGRALADACGEVVLANLTAALLHERCGELSRLRAPGGVLVLSGFLLEDAAALRERYARAGGERRLVTQGEWGALVIGDHR